MELLEPAPDLVDDVKLIVLEYVRNLAPLFITCKSEQLIIQISHPSDLQALCRVSKRWNHVATTQLYRHITINIKMPRSRLGLFEECMYRGALNNLRCTQSLNLYEVACSSDLDVYDQQGYLYEEFETMRQEAILRVLHLFPDNKLSSFRYA